MINLNWIILGLLSVNLNISKADKAVLFARETSQEFEQPPHERDDDFNDNQSLGANDCYNKNADALVAAWRSYSAASRLLSDCLRSGCSELPQLQNSFDQAKAAYDAVNKKIKDCQAGTTGGNGLVPIHNVNEVEALDF